jgi:hypothetical protein
MTGMSISGMEAVRVYRIMDIRPRIATIRKAGYKISEGKIVNGKGAKYWYCTPEQIEFNKNVKKIEKK